MVGLGHLPGGGGAGQAHGISADGSTIVGYGDNGAENETEAFVWTAGSGMQGLGILAPSGSLFRESMANAVSADGSIVVGRTTSLRGLEAFIWKRDSGIMIGLGMLTSEAHVSEALAVSGDGSTIVGASTKVGSLGTRAFIWDEQNGMRELSEVLSDLGIDLTGWTLE
jgi:probable HAF family extracellular repeat protein